MKADTANNSKAKFGRAIDLAMKPYSTIDLDVEEGRNAARSAHYMVENAHPTNYTRCHLLAATESTVWGFASPKLSVWFTTGASIALEHRTNWSQLTIKKIPFELHCLLKLPELEMPTV